MKRIIYSPVLKFLAVLIFIASITLGTLTAAKGIEECNKDDFLYSFENDFSESWFISGLINEPVQRMLNAYHIVFSEIEYDAYGNPVPKDDVDSKKLKEIIGQCFSNLSAYDEINYFAQWNDVVLTNCDAKTAEELACGEHYLYFKRNDTGNVECSTSLPDRRVRNIYGFDYYNDKNTIVISCNIKEEVANKYKAIWAMQERMVIDTFVRVAVCAAVALLMLIYLLCVCGKDRNGEYKNMWLDNIWVELHLAAIGGAGFGAFVLCLYMFEEYLNGSLTVNLIYPTVGLGVAAAAAVIISSLLSVVRNIKTRRFIRTSIVLRVLKLVWGLSLKLLKWLFKLTKRLAKWAWKTAKSYWSMLFSLLAKKSGVILIGALLVYTVFITLIGAGLAFDPEWVILSVLLFGAACFTVAYRSKDLDSIKKGVTQVRGGNVTYKITDIKCSDMKSLAADINDIAIGLEEAVSARVNAERLKSELITNVSHDLKTPITSIISYTELLSQVDGLPEEARDYVAIVAKKSDRLKKLTQDLFDISKVQSGNEDAVMEKLDVALLINQALGEQDNEIQFSGLPFCVEAPKDLYIYADGRKMSRVLGNLINNILKYTMKNTRVFISAYEKDGNVEIEFKNISAYPLDFNAEEITQRFVRGDESRTQEGNGLGLAIAKSYTELCNGSFDVVTDGDMFKAILKFRKV